MLEATLLALGSAALHAFWNLLVKQSAERLFTAWGQFLVGGVVMLPVLVVVGFPDSDAWPYLAISSLVHVVYVLSLVKAYHHGDFSLAYPLARGGGAMVAAVGGVTFLSDDLSALSWLAIAIVCGGLASLVRRHVGHVALLWAGLTALTIGSYTTIDAAGARKSDSGIAYGIALVLGASIAISVYGAARGWLGDFQRYVRRDWRRVALGGVASVVAYSMVLAAIRLAPVGYVASLRESSVVLGAAAGWLVLDERMGRARLVSATGVAVGLVLLVSSR
ncbi:MAG: EamA family transporter [Dehalococcoidia bacterium]